MAKTRLADQHLLPAWREKLASNDALFFTAGLFYELVNDKKFLSLADFSLLVLDEAHHAKKGHHFARIMQLYHTLELHEQPRILALSATLVEPLEQEEDTGASLATFARENLNARIAAPVSKEGVEALQVAQAEPQIIFQPVRKVEDYHGWGREVDDFVAACVHLLEKHGFHGVLKGRLSLDDAERALVYARESKSENKDGHVLVLELLVDILERTEMMTNVSIRDQPFEN